MKKPDLLDVGWSLKKCNSLFNLPAMSNRSVPFHTVDRQWDARFNVPTDEDLQDLLSFIKQEVDNGKFNYCLVSGVEIGTNKYQDDFGIKHVHCCFIYNNRVSKASILKNLNVKQGNGYYLVPRNRSLPYSGWKSHHTKSESKIKPEEKQLFEYGVLPVDKDEAKVTKRSEEEKKRKLDDVIIEMRGMIEEGKEEEAFHKFPRNYLTYGEKIKALVAQKKDFAPQTGDPHIWLYGLPGTGKSAIMQFVYPAYYNKNLDTRFFDLYNPKVHTHILLQDVDHAVVEKLGVQFLKTICDEAGFPIDQKYKSPQLARSPVIITSNFTLDDVVPEDMRGRRETLAALRRRFWHVNIRDLLPLLGLKLLPKYEIQQLKKGGNQDASKIFMSYDYLRDIPTGEPLKEPSHYQEVIRAAFYK